MRDAFPHPYTLADADAWLDRAESVRPETNFAIAVRDEAVGGIGLTLHSDVHRYSAEIGYWLGEAFWGRGITTAAVTALTEYAFSSLDLRRLEAGIYSWNPASMRVLEKSGYRREGVMRHSVVKDGQLIDQVLYAATRDDALSLGEAVA